MSYFVRPLPPLPTIRELLKLYNVSAKKRLSQNFLMDKNLSKKIVKCAGDISNGHVCEIGPGPGGITRCILNTGIKQLIVIEKDERFLPGLELLNDACDGKMRIFHGDALNFDMANIFPVEAGSLWDEPPPNFHIIGNLPFNVATPLLFNWLENISCKTGAWSHGRVKLTLTFQKEVAQRIASPILIKARSRISIMSQYLCYVDHKFTIPGKAFSPAPDVDVGVVHFTPRKFPQISQDFKLVEKVVRHIFQFRQKMCKRGIQTLFPPDRPEFTKFMFESSCVQPNSRPFMLTMEEIGRLCKAYKVICDNNEGVADYYFRSEESAKQWRKPSNIIHPVL